MFVPTYTCRSRGIARGHQLKMHCQ